MKLKIEDILNHKKIDEALSIVESINNNMIGRVALNKEHGATHILYVIKELMGEKCKNVLDIGTLWGGSLITMMQSKYESNFTSIDLFDGYYKSSTGFSEDPVCGGTNTIESVTKNVNKHNKHQHNFDLVEGSSHDETIIKYIKKLYPKIDLLFIDGDHTKKGVLQDWNDYSELVTKDGIVIFDDYWSGDLAGHAWVHKDHWTEPKAMDIVGAYEEIKSQSDFHDNWIEIGLIKDKKIIQRK
jgi:predicted O-methyltransferase YrrM